MGVSDRLGYFEVAKEKDPELKAKVPNGSKDYIPLWAALVVDELTRDRRL